jgi:hypothetical protein
METVNETRSLKARLKYRRIPAADGNRPFNSEKQNAAKKQRNPPVRIAIQAVSPSTKLATDTAATKDELARVRPALVATTVRRVRTFLNCKLFTPDHQGYKIKADDVILGPNDPQRTVIVRPGGSNVTVEYIGQRFAV